MEYLILCIVILIIGFLAAASIEKSEREKE